MPNITVVVWNVETFGDLWKAQRGINYNPISRFIARVVNQVDADVFIMMELRSGGGGYLNTIRAALNALQRGVPYNWSYDYIPGGVVAGNLYPIINTNQLSYTQQAHGEGYAVFWRNAATFNMMATRVSLSRHPNNNESQVGLVFTGRTPNFDVPTGWLVAPDFDPANPPVWNRLDFPEPNPIHEGDIRWALARRPCYCVLELNRPHVPRGQQLLPLVVYHAPNSNFSTRFGVQCAAYSTQLYQVDDTAQAGVTWVTVDQAIAAGDFNLDRNQLGQNFRVTAYHDFTNDYDFGVNGNQGGASLSNTWVADGVQPNNNQTAVRLNRSNGAPIVSANPMDYRWLAIDNLFYDQLVAQPAANYNGPVYDVLSAVMGDGHNFGNLVNTAPKRNLLQAFRQAILAEYNSGRYQFTDPTNAMPCQTRKRNRDDTYSYFGPLLSNIQNYTNYMNDLNNGYFSNARRAAEFYYNSISDHLPLVFRFAV